MVKRNYFGIILVILSSTTACATRPCQKNELLDTGSMGLKFDAKNQPIIDPIVGPVINSMTSEKTSFLISMPSAAESPEPILELVRSSETIRLRPYCGGWHMYNPYGHTWRAGVITPKNRDGDYNLCITVPITGKTEPLTDCSTRVSLNYAFGKKSREQTEKLRKQRAKLKAP